MPQNGIRFAASIFESGVRGIRQHLPCGGSGLFARAIERGFDQSEEERMRAVGAGLEFGMELHADVEAVFGNLYSLNDMSVRGHSAYAKSRRGEHIAVVVVEFVTVAVALGNVRGLIAFLHLRAGDYSARVCAEAHGSALGNLVRLIGHEIYDLML